MYSHVMFAVGGYAAFAYGGLWYVLPSVTAGHVVPGFFRTEAGSEAVDSSWSTTDLISAS